MKRSVFLIGLFLIFLSVIFISSSNVSFQKLNSEWEFTAPPEVDATRILSNFTQGDKVKLVVSPNSEWIKFLEPDFRKYVWVNITDPHGNVSWYEITYAKPRESTRLLVYNVTLMSSNGFGSQEDLQKGKEIIGKAKYTGEYVAEVWATLPGPLDPPGSLAFMKEKITITTEYPYSGYLYPALVMLFIGVVLSVWSAKASKRQVPVKRRTRMKRR